jgi:5-methylcytosine-specific restriction endonuclease McrBC regulatory subunit McrC
MTLRELKERLEQESKGDDSYEVRIEATISVEELTELCTNENGVLSENYDLNEDIGRVKYCNKSRPYISLQLD